MILYTVSVDDQEFFILEDKEKPEEVLSLSGERSYTIEQLLHAIPQIDVIREYNVIHYDSFIELKELKRYSLDFNKRKRDSLFNPAEFSRLFGARAKEVFELLQEYGYAESKKGQIRFKTKVQVATIDDFFLGRSREFERIVFSGLENLLKREVEVGKDEKGNWLSREAYLLYDKRAQPIPMVTRSSRDYIFRIGNRFLYVDFYYIPSKELLELIQLRLTLVYQEQMENFFQIISSFSIERDTWQRGQDRRKRFKEVLESLFSDAWSLFDLEYFSLQIHAREGEYRFVQGSFCCQLNETGEPSWSYRRYTEELPPVFDLSREFLARNVHLVYSQFSGEPITMDVYMRSRSVNNIDPRTSVLLHSFIKMLKEALVRVIETVIPILQMEEANKTLKRHLFLESLRMKNRSSGENINHIINQSLSVIKWLFSIRDVLVYTSDTDFTKMLRIFQDMDKEQHSLYTLMDKPLPRESKQEGNYIEIKVLEQIGENLSFYFRIPMEREEEGYLGGTVVESLVRTVFGQYGLDWPPRGLDRLASWSLSGNTGMITNDLVDWLSHDQEWLGAVSAPQVVGRLVKSFSLFFDLISSLDVNLESGITAMRGTRDRLTGLYNRQSFSKRLDFLFDRGEAFGLLFIDMDTFKIYNDAVSHAFGDKLLIKLASIMLEESGDLEEESLVGRFGGDEFCFAVRGKDMEIFQDQAKELFSAIRDKDLPTGFFLDDRASGEGFEINFISFLHRLLRPDVGGVRGGGLEFTEKKGVLPRERLVSLYGYYRREIDGAPLADGEDDGSIVDYFLETIKKKILKNKIFSIVDEEFSRVISLFLSLQMENKTTDRIRSEIIDQMGVDVLVRSIKIRISAGAAHSSEDRLRSVSSIFNAADARAYMAKHNGRNGLFGLGNQRLL